MDQQKFNRRFLASCMVAAGFLAGLVFLGGIFWFLKSASGTLKPAAGPDPFSGVLLLSGIALFGAVPFVRKNILAHPEKNRHPPSEDRLLSALGMSVIASLALLETACYFYLIYFFIRGEMIYLYAALVLGILGFWLYFPRRENWRRYLDSHWTGGNYGSNTEVDYGQR